MTRCLTRAMVLVACVTSSSAVAESPKVTPVPPAWPARFSEVAAGRGGAFFVVDGCTEWSYHCPPCPPRARCSPCKSPYFGMRQYLPEPSSDMLVVQEGQAEGRGEGMPSDVPGPRGTRLRLVVRTSGASDKWPLEVAFVSGSALGKCSAPTPITLVGSAEMVGTDAAHRGVVSRIVVHDASARPAHGIYLLLGIRGIVARLAFASARDDRGHCPYSAEFTVEGPFASTGDDVHLVVVGPVGGPLPKARLMRKGLALAGYAASAEEPLGVALPGRVATYAVDLDGDGRADLATVHQSSSGPVVHHSFDRAQTEERWERHGKFWSRPAQCRWHIRDLVGP